jgi:LacI family transcriptional regulator
MLLPHRATIKDIAKAAGVSTAAVSQALRPQSKSNIKLLPETVERVKKAAQQLNYRPHSGARSIRSNKFGTIGYFSAKRGLYTPTPQGYISGVHDLAHERGYRITLISFPQGIDEIHTVIPCVFLEHNLDALVIESYSELAYQIHERIRESQLPVIFLNDRHETNSVYVDDVQGGRIATRHLIDRGYQRIGFLHRQIIDTPPIEEMHHSARDREQGYREVMIEAGREPQVHRVETSDLVGLDVELSAKDWEQIMQFDAVVSYDDDLSNLIGRSAYARGLRIPDCLAIASFNGDYGSFCSWQRLTTIKIPSYEMGRDAAELVFRLAKEGFGASLPSSIHQPRLIQGQTT